MIALLPFARKDCAVEPLRPTDPPRIGDHQLLGRLGEGGMGVVYLGRTRGGRTVAIKVVRERFAADPAYRARFRREVAAALGVTGTFTAPLLAADPDAAEPWLVTEYLPGLTLREAVTGFGPLPSVRALAAGLVEALADIHRAGIAHRDLKPSNVLITRGGPRVIDFGIARPEDGTAITLVGSVIGTPGYMSPEQASGGVTGQPSDIYSLGAVLAFASTGKDPIDEFPPVDDPWLRPFLASCLHHDPARRPTAAQLLERVEHSDGRWLSPDLAAALERFENRPVVVAPDVTEDPPAVTPPPRPRRRTLLIGGAVALATAGGAFGLLRDKEQAPPPPAASSIPPTPTSTPPPRAVRRWRVPVSDHFPRLTVAGGVLLAANDDNVMHALDPATGTVLWQREGNTGISQVLGDLLFLPHPFISRMAAIHVPTNAVRWEYATPFPNPSKPLTTNCWGAFAGMVGIGNGPIGALGAADGRIRWTSQVVDIIRGYGADDSLVVVQDDHETMFGLRPADGHQLWSMPRPRSFGNPVVGGGTAFLVDGQRGLQAIRDGAVGWQRPDIGADPGLRWHQGTLYVVDGFRNVVALDAATGTPRWVRKLDGGSSLSVTDDVVYAACTDKSVYALSTVDGRVLWSYPVDSVRESGPVPAGGGPQVIGDLVFAGTRDGFVEAFAAPEGGPRATA